MQISTLCPLSKKYQIFTRRTAIKAETANKIWISGHTRWLHGRSVHQHGVSVAHHQLLLLAIGLPKDGKVREYHNRAGDPERNRARDDGVVLVDHEHALLRVLDDEHLVLLGGVPADEDGQEREQGRRDPGVQQHNADHAFRHANRILERLNNRIVSEITSQTTNSTLLVLHISRLRYQGHYLSTDMQHKCKMLAVEK